MTQAPPTGRRAMRAARRSVLGFSALTPFLLAAPALAAERKPLRLGVLGDENGPFADIGGPGVVEAVRMAVADEGGAMFGRPIEIVVGATQNKPDIAGAIARQWFDVDGVDMIVDLPVTPVALAVQTVARDRKKVVLQTAAASADLTHKWCSPYSVHWIEDTTALAGGTARAVIAAGGRKWFFLTPDYAFGKTLQATATDVVHAQGAEVVGSATFPLGTPDYSSAILAAASSPADTFAFGTTGGDTVNALKQAVEFNLRAKGRRLVVFNMFVPEIHALGLSVAQGLYITSGFYWDENDTTRAFAKRFFAARGKMPNKSQAGAYAATRDYLRAVRAVGSADGPAVSQQMRRVPGDFFGKPVHIRANGRAIYDVTVWQVKTPAESKYAWDYYKPVQHIRGDEVFGPDTKDCAQ